MASMFIKHRVADYARWKPVFDEHEPLRIEYGTVGHSLHRRDGNILPARLRIPHGQFEVVQRRPCVAAGEIRQRAERVRLDFRFELTQAPPGARQPAPS